VREREKRQGLNRDLEGLFGVLRREGSAASIPGSMASTSMSLSAVQPPVTPISPVPDTYPILKHARNACAVLTAQKQIKKACIRQKNVKRAQIRTDRQKAKIVVPCSRKTFKSSLVKKVFRHNILENRFMLNNKLLGKRWSNWQLAMQNTTKNLGRSFKHTRGDRSVSSVWYRKLLFPRDRKPYSRLYEVAVQSGPGRRRHVVLCRTAVLESRRWRKKLLGGFDAARHLKKAMLTPGASIYIRRLRLDRLGRRQRKLVERFRRELLPHYAWRGSNHHRPTDLQWAMHS